MVKYTYRGDANVDGIVSPADYQFVDAEIGIGYDWTTGDLNRDGVVNPYDRAEIDGDIGAGTGGINGALLS